MANLKLYYATNRNHIVHKDNPSGSQFKPDGYGEKFSSSGHENLRFGKLSVTVDMTEVNKHLNQTVKNTGVGNGEKLSGYLTKRSKDSSTIKAYRESNNGGDPDSVIGSKAMFAELKTDMEQASDILVYIHGFNVSWHEAVGSALSLQTMMNSKGADKDVIVVLFSWPSDGKMIPLASYRSDKSDAAASAKPVGRGLLKTRDFLVKLGKKNLCQQKIHLLCHSMGNFVLQGAIGYMQEFNTKPLLPKLFEHVFLCSADVDDSALEKNEPLEAVHQITSNVTIYHNKGDTALVISDYTKGQPERLGGAGAARPNQLHNKVHQVDCSPIVHGVVEHSYYLCGKIAEDIRSSIDNKPQDSNERYRIRTGALNNVWTLTD